MNFGKKIKNLRIKQGKNQRDAAKAIGIDQSYLSLLENDRCVPSEDIFNRLAVFYKINPEHLLEGINATRIYQDFNHLSIVASKLDDYKKSAKMSYRQIFLAAIISCCIGSLFLIIALTGILQSNTIYNYGTITKRQVAYHEFFYGNERDSVKGNVWFEDLSYDDLIKKRFHYVYFFTTRNFLGDKTQQGAPVKHEGIAAHKLIAERFELTMLNRFIIMLGSLLIAIGVAGFVLERHLRFLKPA